MTEYEQKIISQLEEVGFKITEKELWGIHVRNKGNHLIGYLVFSSEFCTIGNEHFSIAFDSVIGESDCARLFRSGIYAGSINL